ncbi:hypothetical protein CEXT_748651 [Caerostris extrusa]|uniref:C2H2-type domain-containing protein n=1 Tax=Caerostris extrusa TaxID=172846 RepID=A0AAV4UDD5_CAEEX|nr:hypothetical protein CEXT_748651 [Caerostris extrusa]
MTMGKAQVCLPPSLQAEIIMSYLQLFKVIIIGRISSHRCSICEANFSEVPDYSLLVHFPERSSPSSQHAPFSSTTHPRRSPSLLVQSQVS